ncbi:hypothetical protein [Candidatus Bathycorpusculum sp.]|uniref:hypothetical protein n=1 Tax=Candidatus Bathycorpusculum sp. TaxID=2994959 RepID=UPI002827FD62|nr:hypothetical protein [Candidatus Termitimicrobium sp.]
MEGPKLTDKVKAAKINLGVFLIAIFLSVMGGAGFVAGLVETEYFLIVASPIMSCLGILNLYRLCEDKINVDAVKKEAKR